MKLSRSEKRLLFLPLAIPVLVVVWQKFRPNILMQELRNIAGPNAIDCGIVDYSKRGAVSDSNACSVAMLKSKKPFIMREAINNCTFPLGYNGVCDYEAIAGNSKGQAIRLYHSRYYKHGIVYREEVVKQSCNLVIKSRNGKEYLGSGSPKRRR